MCAKQCGRRAYARIVIHVRVVLLCRTCEAELYRAGLITRDGTPCAR
jgi:hypothetical protein